MKPTVSLKPAAAAVRSASVGASDLSFSTAISILNSCSVEPISASGVVVSISAADGVAADLFLNARCG